MWREVEVERSGGGERWRWREKWSPSLTIYYLYDLWVMWVESLSRVCVDDAVLLIQSNHIDTADIWMLLTRIFMLPSRYSWIYNDEIFSLLLTCSVYVLNTIGRYSPDMLNIWMVGLIQCIAFHFQIHFSFYIVLHSFCVTTLWVTHDKALYKYLLLLYIIMLYLLKGHYNINVSLVFMTI